MQWYDYLLAIIGFFAVHLIILWAARTNARRRTYLSQLTINGKHLRPVDGICPGCGVNSKTWCLNDCSYLDPMDYR